MTMKHPPGMDADFTVDPDEFREVVETLRNPPPPTRRLLEAFFMQRSATIDAASAEEEERARGAWYAEAVAAVECKHLVAKYFAGDPRTDIVKKWFATKNPMLGGITANDMIAMGRARKLLQVIRDQLAENEPPPSIT